MNSNKGALALAIIVIGGLIVFLFSVKVSPAFARDLGQWENSDPAVVEWYKSLMQPDHPNVPCCGEADAYFADEVHVRGGKTFATVTDTRDDRPLNRHHVPVGTVIEVPDEKLKWDRGNPTGHAVIFLNVNDIPLCFVQGSGI